MSIFARSTFSAGTYAAFRPSYPPSLFNTLLAYHKLPSPSGKLLDIGCGHGLIARALAPNFASVLAIDPSAGMVAQATQSTSDSRISFRQASAEDLSFIENESLDMAVAGQAAHWFKYDQTWPELARVVKKGGTLAFWGYKDNVLLGHERVTEIMERFVYGFGEVAPGIEGMGPYWEQPGRNILRDLLRSVKPPSTQWEDVQRLEHEPGPDGGEPQVWLRKGMKLGEVEGYLRTFSSYGGWRDAHPEIKSRKDGGKGDILDVMWDEMVAAVPEWKAMGEQWRQAEVVSDWGTVLLMARRR